MSDASSPSANAVQMRASIDDDVELTDETVNRGSGTGLMSIGGDPISTLTLRMQVADGSGDFVGEIVDARSTCLEDTHLDVDEIRPHEFEERVIGLHIA